MPQTRAKLGWNIYRHWEIWVALLAIVMFALICSVIGAAYDHRVISLVLGLLIVSSVLHRVRGYIAQRYYPTPKL